MTLYPSLETNEDNGHNFRLTTISNVQKYLEQEIQKYNQCKKKYKTAFMLLNHINNGMVIVTTASACVGVGLLASGFGALPGIIVEGTSIGLGSLSLIGSFYLKKILKKINKHQSIVTLASSKLSDIHKLISKALEDNTVSDTEYKIILDVQQAYKREKQAIQQSSLSPTVLDTETEEKLKKKFTELGKQLEREEIVKRLGKLDS